MVVGSYCVLSQLAESSLTSISSIKYGEALFVFAPTPKSENVRFVNSNKDIIKCFKDPCFVRGNKKVFFFKKAGKDYCYVKSCAPCFLCGRSSKRL